MVGTSKRLRVAVLFGGRSAEHDVSLLSATNVMRALDPGKYEVVPVFVTREGRWLIGSFENGVPQRSESVEVCLVPGGEGRMLAIPAEAAPYELPRIDVLFPVLHGLHGEDGAVQGLAEVARVPLAGCGLLGSATALDKDVAKRLFKEAGVPVARSIAIRQGSVPPFADVERALGLPIFIKPARQGSSVGVGKVSNETDYRSALAEGFTHDRKLLAEEFIDGRELECGVLEDAGGDLFVSRFGEIVPAESHGFYTYEAKYLDQDGAVLKVPADLPQAIEDRMRETAVTAFNAAGCDGMARIDFFVRADMSFVINEINTIPGFTDISMYSKVMAASGVDYAAAIDRLVAHGLARAAQAS